jgi:hypothetical protein
MFARDRPGSTEKRNMKYAQ